MLRFLNKKTSFFKNQYQLFQFKKKVYFNLNLQDWIQNQIFFLEKYEDFELNFASEVLKEGDTFIDIGANFGLYSLFCATFIGKNGRVISFEPFHENYKIFEKNLKLNSFNNIQLIKKAVADEDAVLDLFYNINENNLGMVSSYNFSNQKPERVHTVSIDSYLSENKINSLKYVKIDIEGGEYLALKGMINTLKQFRPIIQIEIDDTILAKTPYKRLDIYNLFDEIGYEIFVPKLSKNLKQVQESYSKNCFFRNKSPNID